MIKKILSLFNRSIFRTKTRFAGTFVVNIRVDHPQMIGGAAHRFRLAIDADSEHHARQRLQQELVLKVGKARRVNVQSPKK